MGGLLVGEGMSERAIQIICAYATVCVVVVCVSWTVARVTESVYRYSMYRNNGGR